MLTTIAGPVSAYQVREPLPPSYPERFLRSDFVAALMVLAGTLAVYIATLAPNVTLGDSGELITGAAGFGVPHPPGYPLWTFSGFLFAHLIPFGNIAWRINLESAVFAALANAVLTLLVCHSGRWLVQRWAPEELLPVARRLCFYGGLLAGFILGFSDVMWSQAVIAEVYTLNALFVNLVLLCFYFWMLDPTKSERLTLAVFVFALGLTNHHTLIQMIPAFLLAAWLVRAGQFWSVLLGVLLFSLSILLYLGWLSRDQDLQRIGFRLAVPILGLTGLVAFVRTRDFVLRRFLIGAVAAAFLFAFAHYGFSATDRPADLLRVWQPGWAIWLWGSYRNPGWLQVEQVTGLALLLGTAVSFGLVWNSRLNRRLILGVIVAGWVGLMPYAYMRIAAETHPPMNWGFTVTRSGFYYAVTRHQYPTNLPWLIKSTFGRATLAVSSDSLEKEEPHIDYLGRLGKTFYYYGDNLQDNFTVPLLCLILALVLYLGRCDRPQVHWLIFLGVAFFFLGFMLHLIQPPDGFDFNRNLQFKVFHLQSHCIFVLMLGYGAIAGLLALATQLREYALRFGAPLFGAPALCLALLPLCSNYLDCNQAGHWFGYQFGIDAMRQMEPGAIYLGGSDPGRFVPTYMAFVESQQPNFWKREPGFDRRDVAVITQNALCDAFYNRYIREQYDNRFRPAANGWTPLERWLGRAQAYPVTDVHCLSDEELATVWRDYGNLQADRLQAGGPLLRPGGDDVFELDAVAARFLFEQNKDKHTFYLEQSQPLPWMYPYLLPAGLIFRLAPEPMHNLAPDLVQQDLAFWDAYTRDLLSDPHFLVDEEARSTFARLAYYHADLFLWRGLIDEQEHLLRLTRQLSPPMYEAVEALARIDAQRGKFPEAIAEIEQGEKDDPRNDRYGALRQQVAATQLMAEEAVALKKQLEKKPNEADLLLRLARIVMSQGKVVEGDRLLRRAAVAKKFTKAETVDLVHYYVDTIHQPGAAIAFLEERVKAEPNTGELVYNLASLNAVLGRLEPSIRYLQQAIAVGGREAALSAQQDPRFAALKKNPRFIALIQPYLPPVPAK